MRNFSITAFLLLILVACSTVKTSLHPVESDVTKYNDATASRTTLPELEKGFNLYVTHCGGCHSLPLPTAKNKYEWETLLPEMFSRTKVNESEKQLIAQYVYSKL